MVVEPLAPPVALIQRIHAAWRVGGLAHVLSKAAGKVFVRINKLMKKLMYLYQP